jgi:predicted amidohydrolase
MKVHVGIAQLDISIGDKDTNIRKAFNSIDKLASQGAEFILLPELWTTAYADNIYDLAENRDSELFTQLTLKAKENNIYIMGSVPLKEGDKLYNSMHLIGPDGLIGFYHKTHLIKLMGEHKIFEAGNSVEVYNVNGYKIGMMICYDLRFPEFARTLALKGAEIIFICAEWPCKRIHHWRSLILARAIENQVYMVACNRVGTDKYHFCGNSLVASPKGNILIEAGEGEKLLAVEIDLSEIVEMRKLLPLLDERRRDIYYL